MSNLPPPFRSIICNGLAREVDVFSAAEIIRLYKSDLGIDTARYFSGIDNVRLLECQVTGLRFYWPQNCMGDSDFYDRLQEQPGYYIQQKWEHLEALKWITPEDHILEVGAGDGYFLQLLAKAKHIKHTPVGLELSPAAIRSASERGIKLECEFVEQHALTHRGIYDVVCGFQILEHVSDPRSFIQSCLDCVKPGGILIFATPCCDPYIFHYDRWHTLNLPPHHALLWSPKAYHRVGSLFGMQSVEIKQQPSGADLWHLSRVWMRHFTGNQLLTNLVGILVHILPDFIKKSIGWFLPGHAVLVKLTKSI